MAIAKNFKELLFCQGIATCGLIAGFPYGGVAHKLVHGVATNAYGPVEMAF